MYERILIPTDGSDHANAAAERAFTLAEALNAEVFVLSVVDTGLLGSIRLPGDPASAEEAFTEQARTFVSRLHDQARERGLEVTSEIRHGLAVQEILDYTDAVDADVIVMGTRGRGGFDQMVLGSVTEGVTRYGEVDVLVVDTDDTR